MRKMIQSFTMLAILWLLLTPAMYGETMGTNPRPRPAVTMSTMLEAVTSAIVSYLGFR